MLSCLFSADVLGAWGDDASGLLGKTTSWMAGGIYVCAQVGREWWIGVGTSPLVKAVQSVLCKCVTSLYF